jgi:hypothetical protein
MIDSVPLVKPESTGLRLLRFVAGQIAESISSVLPPGVGFALILTDGGPEGFWSVRTGGNHNHLQSAASWLGSCGILIGEPAPQSPVEKGEDETSLD